MAPSPRVAWMNWPRLKPPALRGSFQPLRQLHCRLSFWQYKEFSYRGKTGVVFIQGVAPGLISRITSLPATAGIVTFKYSTEQCDLGGVSHSTHAEPQGLVSRDMELGSLRGRPIWVRNKQEVDRAGILLFCFFLLFVCLFVF